MNIGAKIGIGVGIPIAIIVIVLALNVYAISNLQFQGKGIDNFDLVDLSMDAQFVACNPTFFPASFNTLSVDINYKSTNFGTFTIWGKTIPPSTPTDVSGRLNLNGESVMQLLLAAFGSVFGGPELDIDPNQVRYVAKLDAPILGVIPFSVTESYTADEFMDMVSGQSGEWSCGAVPTGNIFEQMGEESQSLFLGGQESFEDVFEQSQQTVEEVTPKASDFDDILSQISEPFNTATTHEVIVTEGSAVPGCEEFDLCYIPATLVVNTGDTITWYNDDSAAHTVTSGTAADGPDGAFDSSLFMAGDSFSVTFDFEGEYPYFCMVHPWQTGEVIVTSSLPKSEVQQYNCDSSYPTVCIPPYPPDLDCDDVSYRNFLVTPPDPHGFDRDKDRVGCES